MNARSLLARFLGGVTLLSATLGLVGTAAAHPLGNFTVNRYARVEVSAGTIRVYYVLDEAEIPAFQDREAIAADPERFATARVADIDAGLALTIDGTAVELEPVDFLLSEPAGEGGLSTLRLDILFAADIEGANDQVHVARFVDSNEPDRIGWREMVVEGRGDAEIVSSTVAAEDLSDELRSYPDSFLAAPLDQRLAEFEFTTGTELVEARRFGEGSDTSTRGGGDGFTRLVARQDLTPIAIAGVLGLALLFGAAHALAPGHGKTVMAAYLVGTRGRPVDAVLLGALVSAMHTISVLVVGLALFQLDRSVSLDLLYPRVTLLTGLAVLGVGLWLLVRRGKVLRPASHAAPDPAHGHHDHGHHDHGHHEHREHDHGHHDHGEHGHSHELPEGVPPLSRKGLVVLATAGGVLPSPSAVIVLVSSFALGRIGLGLALVAAFSLGLALTLTVVGLALVLGGRSIEGRVSGRVMRLVPVLSAAVLVIVGVALIVQGGASW